MADVSHRRRSAAQRDEGRVGMSQQINLYNPLFLRQEKQSGRRLVLATASNERIARAVANHLGIFDEVVASDAGHNLSSHEKLAALQEKFGKGNFDYIGNSHADIPLFCASPFSSVLQSGRRVAYVSYGKINSHGFNHFSV